MATRRRMRIIIPRFPLYNIYTRVAAKTTALGPIVIATAVARVPGWDVEVIDENNYHDPAPRDAGGLPDHAALQRERPADVVGFYGGLTSTIPRLFAVATWYREQGVFTVGGGQHLAALPAEALANGLAVVLHGEAEDTMADLLAARDAGLEWRDLPGISYVGASGVITTSPREPREDFAQQPNPDFGLLRYARVQIHPVSRIRGCGMACEFCTVRGKPRCASPEKLMDQISRLVECDGARELFVVDDHFAQDRAETIRLCRLLADYRARTGVKLFITVQIRLDCAGDPELLEAMYAAGIRVLAVGLETPIDAELKAMTKRQDAASMAGMVRRFRDAGFMVHGMFIFAYPLKQDVPAAALDRATRVRAFRRFIRASRLDTIQILLPVPLPGTPFRERMAASGRLVAGAGIGWEHHDGTFPLVVPDSPLSVADLHRAQDELMGSFYRFRSLFGMLLHTASLPFLVLPPIGVHARWLRWRRGWRNRAIACAGSVVVRRWRRCFRESAFPAYMRRQTAALKR